MVAELRLCIPSDQSWERFVELKHRPAARYLMHLINHRRQRWHADRQGFVRLKYDYLRAVIGGPALTKIRRSLADADAIVWDKQYVKGQSSMGYRLTSRFEPSTIELCRDPLLVRRVQRLWCSEERRLLPVHRWLREKLTGLVFDHQRARSIVSGMTPEADSILSDGEYRQLLFDSIAVFSDQLITGDVPLICDDYGRVHSPLTRMPKSIRCCLSTPDGPLIGIDLANSQPLFAGLVARIYETATKQARQKLRIWLPPKRPYGRCSTHIPTHTRNTTEESLEVADRKEGYGVRFRGPADLSEYIDLCQTGRLYDELKPSDMERSEFKQRIFTDVFFGADRHPSKIRNRFQSRFPAVAWTISDLKSAYYKRLSWLMQHEESKLFIGRVCRRLMRERPAMPLYTIHDCLVTTEEYIEFVRRVAMDEFAVIGVAPTFTVETWDDAI